MAQGQPSSLFPLVVSLKGVDRVFFAAHTSSKSDGNWIELSGGTTVELPPMDFIYDGPDIEYDYDEVTVKMDSDFIYDLTYPLETHQVYEEGDSISAKFWGSPDLDKLASFRLLKVSSLSKLKDDFVNEDFLGILDTLFDIQVWSQKVTLDSTTGDKTVSLTAPDPGDYLLVVAKIDLNPLNPKFYIYSATAIEVVDDTLVVSAPSSVEKGDPVNVNSKLASEPTGSYTHVAAMIKESAYSCEIKLSTDNNVPDTEIYLNDAPMADGSLFTDFFLGNEDQSYITLDLIEEKLMMAFDSDELAFGYTTATHTGSISLSTSSLDTGNYVLLVGVWKDFETRIVGLKQTSVKVKSPYEPPPTPPKNKKPTADAGPNLKISMGSTIHFSGAGSKDPDGNIVSYDWDFGDGTTASGITVEHEYSEPGLYTVTLTVKDNKGAEDFDKCTVMVWEPPAPVVDKFGVYVPGEQKGFRLDASEAANTNVILDTIDPVTVTILKYDGNPQPLDPIPATAIQIYVDVEVSNPDAVIWPIYVKMFYTDEEVEGLDEASLGIYYWKNGVWKRCSDTGVDTERNVVWAYMTAEEASGSPILMGGMPTMIIPVPPLPPILSDLTITPTEIELGEEVNIGLDIENIDSQSFTYIVTMRIGELTLLVDVELEPYESKTVSRTITPDAVGDYEVTVDGMTGSFTVNPLPTPPRPAEFEFSNLEVYPEEVEEGEAVTVSVDVTNIGEEMGSYTVELVLDGVVVESEEITPLEGGLTTTVIFEILGDVGTHQVEVEGMTVSFTVLPPPEEPPFWTQTGYIAGILTLLIAASALIYAYRKGMLPLPSTRKD